MGHPHRDLHFAGPFIQAQTFRAAVQRRVPNKALPFANRVTQALYLFVFMHFLTGSRFVRSLEKLSVVRFDRGKVGADIQQDEAGAPRYDSPLAARARESRAFQRQAEDRKI